MPSRRHATPHASGSRDLDTGPRIALVDDEAVLRTTLRLLLERAGFAVVCEAGDGAAGLVEVREHRPDVIIADLQMPGVDGLAFTESLRRTDAETPIIMLTAFVDGPLLEQAAEVGVTAVVSKQDGMAHVIPTIRDVLSATSGPTPLLR